MVTYQWAQQASVQWTRIDMLLALLEETIRVLKELLRLEDNEQTKEVRKETQWLWHRSQLLVAALISGVNPALGEVAISCLRLYEYVHYVVQNRKVGELAGAVRILETIHSGFESIRHEAVNLERQGLLPPLWATSSWELTA
ncbi:MAG: hypothetical protein RMI91_03595 [Gemmatales bacterium]|nr:hypothetical protein [Gemmatales bacterium]MDW7993716.1 hypothetical protein [Gemmatales bacterium]